VTQYEDYDDEATDGPVYLNVNEEVVSKYSKSDARKRRLTPEVTVEKDGEKDEEEDLEENTFMESFDLIMSNKEYIMVRDDYEVASQNQSKIEYKIRRFLSENVLTKWLCCCL
jgi:hypothetical protein